MHIWVSHLWLSCQYRKTARSLPCDCTVTVTATATAEMCDHHHMRSGVQLVGDIEHVHHLSDNIGALFMQSDYSDITLLVENDCFPAHKVILASRSEYFRCVCRHLVIFRMPHVWSTHPPIAPATVFVSLFPVLQSTAVWGDAWIQPQPDWTAGYQGTSFQASAEVHLHCAYAPQWHEGKCQPASFSIHWALEIDQPL